MRALAPRTSPWLALVVLCSWLVPMTGSPAADAIDPGPGLAAFLDRIETLQGRFSQLTEAGDGRTRRLDGVFFIHRPGRFRWEYHRPYEQTIVTDGHRLMIYDRDLAQLTIRPMDDTGSASGPAALLSGGRSLESSFVIRRLDGADPGLRWFDLVPRSQDDDGEFERIRLALDERGLRRMEVVDRLGNRTRIDFEAVKYDAPIDDALFDLRPPPGTDVIDETAR